MAKDERRFIIVSDERGTPNREEVTTGVGLLGGPVSAGNVFVGTYAKVLGKILDDLEVGESTACEFSLSGQRGVYHIVRVI